MGRAITQPKQLLVEGKDEVHFFSELISHLELANIEVRDVGGKTQFRNRLKALIQGSGHENITSIGIVRDADDSPAGAFQSICDALSAVDLPVPKALLQPVGDAPRVTVMILPGKGRKGMLEDLCLESVTDDPAMTCVKTYFECLKEQVAPETFPRNPAKARVRAFLAAMEWIEEGYFESIQEHLRSQPPDNPIVEQVHTFLASRYKPNLALGIAAKVGYWQLDHPAFEQAKEFLHIMSDMKHD